MNHVVSFLTCNVETMIVSARRVNPLAINIISPMKGQWPPSLFTIQQNFRLVQIKSGFADDKINMTNIEFCLCKGHNILGKGENAGYQNFLLFP